MSNDSEEMMDSIEHPQDHQILDYVKTPELSKFSQLRLHLAACRYCRRRAELTALIRDQGHWLEAEAVDIDAPMADLMADRLDDAQAEQLRQTLKQDPAALRAALHFASHASAMDSLTKEFPVKTKTGSSVGDWLRNWLPASIWQAVPAMALVMMLAVILVNQYRPGDAEGQLRVVAFNDNPVIQIVGQETQPGIGFFTQQGVNARPFGGMQIELSPDNQLHFSWPEVDKALFYTLKLQLFQKGETRVLSRQTLDTNTALVELSEIPSSLRYEWVLSGDIDAQQSFQASGGFVITTD